MKKQAALLITVLVFLGVLVGAYVLYDRLADDYAPDNLLAQAGSETSGETEQMTIPSESDTGSQPESNAESTQATEQAEKPLAPDFTVYDGEGNPYRLSDFIGKPVVLNFWASWCGPCKSEMPEFDEAYAEMGEDVHFLMVNLTDGQRETLASAKAYVEGQGYSLPIYYDTDMDAAMQYGVSSIPATYFIDAEGHPVAYGIGALDKETLLKGIAMAEEATE